MIVPLVLFYTHIASGVEFLTRPFLNPPTSYKSIDGKLTRVVASED
jgi:hypothetical protein